MKALTSTCSKAIVERLPSSSSRGALHVADRPELCFSRRYRNDKKGCNFRFLKLVPSKGIYPVHAVPLETQVDLETVEVELQAQQTNESKFVHVKFQLQKICNFGEQFLIVGDDPMFGSWDPSNALSMTWSDGHIWSVELDMPAGKSIQFKFILKGKEGDIIWQPGRDRIIHTWETMNRITVCEDWENAELQKIIEEDQLVHSNEESQSDSEMITFAENLGHIEEGLVSKASGIEDSQTDVEEKPLAEPDLPQIIGGDRISSSMEKPKAIVADNISSSEDHIESTSHSKIERSMIHQNDEFANSRRNNAIMHDLKHNRNALPVVNQKRTDEEGKLFDFEGGPVLVPGLTPPSGEAGQGEVEERITMDKSMGAFETKETPQSGEAGQCEVEERITMDKSMGAFETKEQNMPEFSEEQESDDGAPLEINATNNNEPKLLHHDEYEERSDFAAAMEDMSNSQQVDGDVLQNDIHWGRETLKKFLTKFGFLL